MRYVNTPKAPRPGGHYSQAVVHDGIVYVSGQLPLEAATQTLRPGSIEEQCALVIENTKAILEAAGSSLGDVLKCTIYMVDVSLWDRVNAVYAKYFGEHKPARAVVPVSSLHYGALIEMECMAIVRKDVTRIAQGRTSLDYSQTSPQRLRDQRGIED